MIGETLGRFHITARLGAGGMGEVYRARDTRLGRDVAINPRTFAVATDGRILLLQVLRSPTRGRMPVLVTGWGKVLAAR